METKLQMAIGETEIHIRRQNCKLGDNYNIDHMGMIIIAQFAIITT